MILPGNYIDHFTTIFPDLPPWQLTGDLRKIIWTLLAQRDAGYQITNDIAIHKSAVVEPGATLKGPIIISENCFVAAHAYLRGGVFLDRFVTIGPGCEIKSSIIFSHSTMAHFNFIGDSIIGHHVNVEAGAMLANHFNEKPDKRIFVFSNGKAIDTGTEKFGALIGDHCRIGANAVLSPGTILERGTIVGRLVLVDQSVS